MFYKLVTTKNDFNKFSLFKIPVKNRQEKIDSSYFDISSHFGKFFGDSTNHESVKKRKEKSPKFEETPRKIAEK